MTVSVPTDRQSPDTNHKNYGAVIPYQQLASPSSKLTPKPLKISTDLKKMRLADLDTIVPNRIVDLVPENDYKETEAKLAEMRARLGLKSF